MPLRFHVPLPGPFSYSRRISGDGATTVAKGCLAFAFLMFFAPLWLCFALMWWTLVACYLVTVGLVKGTLWVGSALWTRLSTGGKTNHPEERTQDAAFWAQAEQDDDASPAPSQWFCDPCGVEVNGYKCPKCGEPFDV
ncbi:hypothetical protein [Allokutzneria albata]|uniref:Uncharacterized protein n=1 Tax=Allokutzneria albata TaxID=211114 RepID=A0A1H0DVL2_ALLAB|nr:hypothetical protein [Allokutzneria albata]SDN74190.1 hypothetical protein SAMN04489726_8018 [Allokutzneria albata]